jgi:SagB-type dehydrogenase family enzyme
MSMGRFEDTLQLVKSDLWRQWPDLDTGERRKEPPPPLQKPVQPDAELVDLVAVDELSTGRMPLIDAISRRRSHRRYLEVELAADELSFLLWATQGISRVFPDTQSTWRTVPSGGARHPFETYLLVNRAAGLTPGIYRYVPLEHQLCLLDRTADLGERVHKACYKQHVRGSAATFIWTAIPARTDWRYSILSAKLILLDAGHVCQNLYLAAEAMGAGACAVAAYDQEALDAVLDVDGRDEFAVYVATVGKIG